MTSIGPAKASSTLCQVTMVGVTIIRQMICFIFTRNSALEWVISHTRDRLRRELEADEKEYEERLAAARKREEAQKRKFFARNVKRQVRYLYLLSCAIVADVQHATEAF